MLNADKRNPNTTVTKFTTKKRRRPSAEFEAVAEAASSQDQQDKRR